MTLANALFEQVSSNSKCGVVKSLSDVILGLDHVAIAVTDLPEAVKWFVECLGFEVIDQRVTRGDRTSMVSAVVKAGKAVVVLLQGVEPDSQISRFVEKFGPGVQHIAFSITDMDVALQMVEAGGGKPDTTVIADEGIRQVFLRRDPGSGVRVELIERRGGNFSDKTVEELFRSFEAQDMY